MFAKSIVTSDLFLDMPMSARCLYFTFGMFADDDGFINSPKSIMRQIGASVDDFNILLAKGYIIGFAESGVIVIKHWKVNNYLQKDRYRPTVCVTECSLLDVDEKGVYSLKKGRCIQGVYSPYTQDRIGKIISHETRACAHEEKEQKSAGYGLKEFMAEYPNVRNDVPLKEEEFDGVDFEALAKAFKESEWLRGVDSLGWIITNSEKILSGKYKTFKTKPGKTVHFTNEREYAREDLNKLLKEVDDIEF